MDDSVNELERRNINLKMYEIFNKKLDDFQNRQQSFLLSLLVGLGVIIGFFIQNFNQITTLTKDVGSSYIIYLLIFVVVIFLTFCIYSIVRLNYYRENIEVINGHLRSLEQGGNLLCPDPSDNEKWEDTFKKQKRLRDRKTIDVSVIIAAISAVLLITIVAFSISRVSSADLQKAISKNNDLAKQIKQLELQIEALNKKNPVTPIIPVTPVAPTPVNQVKP